MQTRLILVLLSILLFAACKDQQAPSPTPAPQIRERPTRDYQQVLDSLGLSLPTLGPPQANYVHTVRTGNLVFTSGKGPLGPQGTGTVRGKVGADLTVEQGYAAARSVGLKQLAALQQELGDLNRVRRIVKVLGMVNCPSDFTEQPAVINGFSDLMVEVFGERGKHARSAVGMGSLPGNIAVEIELVVEVYP